MVTGFPGLGKATFINTLFSSDIYNSDHQGPSKRSTSDVPLVEHATFDLCESNVKLRLSVIDTPGYGCSMDNSDCWKPASDYIESQFETYLRAEMRCFRKIVGSGNEYIPVLPDDHRVHACLYFVHPNTHGLHPVDLIALQKLHNKVNVILIIGRSDSLTTEECRSLKEKINQQLSENNIVLYDFPEDVATLGGGVKIKQALDEVREWRKRQPFAVTCGDQTIEHSDGRKVLGRAYPWGVVETDNLAHNDFPALKNLLLKKYLYHLIDTTHTKHYAAYYFTRLSEVAKASNFPVSEDGLLPLFQLESERLEHDQMLERMREQCTAAIREKVDSLNQQLQRSNEEYEMHLKQFNEQTKQQGAQLDRERARLDAEVAAWEKTNPDAKEILERAKEKSKRKMFSLHP